MITFLLRAHPATRAAARRVCLGPPAAGGSATASTIATTVDQALDHDHTSIVTVSSATTTDVAIVEVLLSLIGQVVAAGEHVPRRLATVVAEAVQGWAESDDIMSVLAVCTVVEEALLATPSVAAWLGGETTVCATLVRRATAPDASSMLAQHVVPVLACLAVQAPRNKAYARNARDTVMQLVSRGEEQVAPDVLEAAIGSLGSFVTNSSDGDGDVDGREVWRTLGLTDRLSRQRRAGLACASLTVTCLQMLAHFVAAGVAVAVRDVTADWVKDTLLPLVLDYPDFGAEATVATRVAALRLLQNVVAVDASVVGTVPGAVALFAEAGGPAREVNAAVRRARFDAARAFADAPSAPTVPAMLVRETLRGGAFTHVSREAQEAAVAAADALASAATGAISV